MSKMNYGKRNLEEKVRRQKGESIIKNKSKKVTAKQISLMRKLGIRFDSNMNRKTASDKISEALKNV